MRFKIDAIDRTTGKPISPQIIEAASKHDAIKSITDRGVMIINVREYYGADSISEESRERDHAPKVPELLPDPDAFSAFDTGMGCLSALGGRSCLPMVVALVLLGAIGAALGFSGPQAILAGLVVVAVIVGVAAAIWIAQGKKADETINRLFRDAIGQIPDFNETHRLGILGRNMAVIDQDRKKICLLEVHERQFRTRVISFRDILACELVLDRKVVTVTEGNRGAAIGGAVLAGTTGAVIGAAGPRKSESHEEVTSSVVRLTLNDINSPSFPIPAAGANHGRAIHAAFTVIMHQASL